MSRWRFWALSLLLGTVATQARAIPLQTIGTFCGSFPDQCRKGTESLLAVRGIGTDAYYVLEVDPTTGAIPVEADVVIINTSVGPTGAAVPADGTYIGLNNAGTLIGAVGDSSGRQIVVGAGTAGTPAGGLLTVQGAGIAGTPSGSVLTVQGVSGGTAQPGNITQFGGTNISTGTGTGGAGIPRVTVSSDSSLSVTNLPTTAATDVGISNSSTLRVVQAGYPSTTTVVASNSYSSTNVTTAAYVQLIAATANAVNTVCLSSANAANIKVATGAAASEVDRIYLPGGGAGCYNVNIPASTRVSLRAIDVTASTGYFLFTGY